MVATHLYRSKKGVLSTFYHATYFHIPWLFHKVPLPGMLVECCQLWNMWIYMWSKVRLSSLRSPTSDLRRPSQRFFCLHFPMSVLRRQSFDVRLLTSVFRVLPSVREQFTPNLSAYHIIIVLGQMFLISLSRFRGTPYLKIKHLRVRPSTHET